MRARPIISARTRMTDMAERPPDGVLLDKMPNHCAMELPAGVMFLIDQVGHYTYTHALPAHIAVGTRNFYMRSH